MFNKLIALSLRHKLGVGIGVAALLAWGLYALRHLPIDAVPDITNNQVIVFTVSPSLSAADVERLVTFPVEQSVATIPGREEVRSFSRAGLSVVTIVFGDAVDNYWARQQVAERLRAAEAQIPPGLGQPEMGPPTTGLGEIYQYAIRVKPGFEKKYSLAELRTLQDWVVRRQLLGTPGVADVSSFGGYLRQYEVAVEPARLRSFGLTVGELQQALSRNNANAGGGYLVRGPQAWFIRTEGLAQSEADIERVVVRPAAPGRGPVLVRDVAAVRPGAAPRYGALIRSRSGETVGGLVLMLRGANASEVVAAVKTKMAAIEKTLPAGLEIKPFLDRTKLVDQAIHTVEKNLAEGALIVIFVLVLFLGNLRAGLLVASVIPLAMLFAIALMQVFGVSGNLMSLGAIDFGLIVDGAVIIVEATMHRLTAHFSPAHGDGEIPLLNEDLTPAEMDEEVYDAASRIQQSASFGQFIILMVYLPILALVGIEGKMFRPMAQTVAFAILGAFILSLTYVPVMSALVLRKGVRGGGWSDRLLARLAARYRSLVTRVLAVPRLVLAAALALLVGAALLLGTLGGEFIPTLEEGDFAVETRVLPGSSLDHTARQAQLASDILKDQFPEVREVVAKVGSSEIPVDPMPLEACDLIVVLKDRAEWTSADNREALAAKMAKALQVLPGVTYSFQQPIQMRFNELISGARQDVVVKIYGEDLDQLAGYARRVGAVVRRVPGATDLYVEQATGLAQIVVQPDRERLAQFGLSIQDLNQSIEAAFAGAGAGQVFEGDRRFDLVVRLAEEFRHDIQQVRALNVPLPGGGQVPLEQVARVDYQVGPSQIQRDNAQRRITVGFNVRGRDVESVVQDVQAAVQREVKFAPGYVTTYGGQFENLRQANARLAVAVPAALLMIFGLLYLTFGSLRQALLIFTAIPLAAVGGVLALWLRGLPFSISAGVGFIALFGVAVLNGIVLLSSFNHLRDAGLRDVRLRVLRGTEERLRPVLMTATVASLGFLPMALAGTAGAEVQRPLATVVIGGLVSATLLTLLVLPVLYYLSESEGGFWRNLLGRRPQAAAAALGVGLLLALAPPAAAQTPAPPDPATTPLTAAGAVQAALGRSGEVQAAGYQLSARSALRGAVWELPRTTVQAGYGQFNSPYFDNQFSLAQPLPGLGRYRALTGLAEAQVSVAESELVLRRAELRRQVRLSYQQAVYARHRLRLLRAQDSLSREFSRSANLRFRTGEAARIEPATALVQQGETRLAQARARSDYHTARRQLQALLQLPAPPAPADSLLRPLPLAPELQALLADTLLAAPADTAAPTDPTAQLLARQTQERRAEALVQLRSRRPELGLSYLNQSLRGTINYRGAERFYGPGNRFHAAQLSLSVPLWTRPYKARDEAARLQTLAAEAAYRRRVAEVAAAQATLLGRLREQQQRLQFYEQTGLPQAALILRLAGKGWRAGEMPFAEYLLHAERAQRLRTDYLDAVLAYNQTVLEVEYLLGRTD